MVSGRLDRKATGQTCWHPSNTLLETFDLTMQFQRFDDWARNSISKLLEQGLIKEMRHVEFCSLTNEVVNIEPR